MSEKIRVGILDFNKKRMNDTQAEEKGIPVDLRPQVADFRQYPFKIGAQLPESASWFNPKRLWYFKDLLTDPEKTEQLRDDDVLILSGSGLSAYKYQEGQMDSGDAEQLKIAEEVIKERLGRGGWILGICFGGQMAIHAVNGEIGRLPKNGNGFDVTEAGWLPQELTAAGKTDELFGYLPETFYAPHFHNDYVTQLPIVGSKVQTSSGELTVTKSEILAIRHGFIDENGLESPETEYPMASVIEFDNGARIYQIQPHPEMATPQNANFLVRMNPWMKDEMGKTCYYQALKVPEDADFSVADIIRNFIELAKEKVDRNNKPLEENEDMELERRKPYLIN